jgi:hypothetical protein
MRYPRALLGLLLFALAFPASGAEPKVPPPPAEYDALVRFWVEGFRNQRARSVQELKNTLQNEGFREDADEAVDPLDPGATYLHGTIPGKNARQMLEQRFVRAIRLVPKSVPLPEKGKPVRVVLDLAGGMALEQQRQLAQQVRQTIRAFGFQEAVAYNDRGSTRLVGLIPSEQLDTLASDLQRHPVGWELLGKPFLADMHTTPRGAGLLRQILDDWYDHPEGQKILRPTLAVWSGGPEAARLLATLPIEVADPKTTANRIKLDVLLLAQMADNAGSDPVLEHIFTDVLASKANRELMNLMLRRVAVQPTAVRLPLFFRVAAPIRVVEGFPGQPVPSPRPAAIVFPPGEDKITVDLRELLNEKNDKAEKRRFEVFLQRSPGPNDRNWRERFPSAAPDIVVEGILGSMVTVKGTVNDVVRLATLPEVTVIRLARVARTWVQTDPARAGENFTPLTRNGLEKLHRSGQRGRGARVAVISSDFRGWQALVGKQLPEGTRLVDLTTERNESLLPDLDSGDAKTPGPGVLHALLLLKAAPSAELTLIRVDPAAPYQILTVARIINGEAVKSVNMDHRFTMLEEEGSHLASRKEKLLEERREILNHFSFEDADVARRKDYFRRQAEFDREQEQHNERLSRYFKLLKAMQDLKGIKIVASSLVWSEGHPLDGASPLSRYFDDQPFKGALWFQAAGDTVGQAWTGLFRDSDGNGVMEFVPANSRLADDAWSRELNRLDWQADASSPVVRDLPANTPLRISLQWREAHDPSFYLADNAPYRQPIANFRIVLLYQADPKGEKQASDDFRVIAESTALPQLLEQGPSAATYEHLIQVRLPQGGRYVVRIEGQAPTSTRPVDAPTIPIARRVGEVRPRLFVETLEGAGRALWHDHVSEGAGLGIPGDALRVITVGSANQAQRRSFTAPDNPLPACKPDLVAEDQINPNQAVSFAAGMAALLPHTHISASAWLKQMQQQSGQALRVLEDKR